MARRIRSAAAALTGRGTPRPPVKKKKLNPNRRWRSPLLCNVGSSHSSPCLIYDHTHTRSGRQAGDGHDGRCLFPSSVMPPLCLSLPLLSPFSSLLLSVFSFSGRCGSELSIVRPFFAPFGSRWCVLSLSSVGISNSLPVPSPDRATP